MGERRDDVEPKLGDLIEIDRVGYQHWAIYVGDGYIIHLSPESEGANGGSNSMMSVLHDRAIVKMDRLKHADINNIKINNLLDHKYEPRSVNDILKDARSLVGQELQYSVIRYNCEHFVTELRYGKPESRQVRHAATNVGISATIIAGILSIVYALGRIFRHDRNQNSQQDEAQQ